MIIASVIPFICSVIFGVVLYYLKRKEDNTIQKIKCKACGNEIFNKTEICMYCGVRNFDYLKDREVKQAKGCSIGFVAVLLVVSIFLFLFLFVAGINNW